MITFPACVVIAVYGPRCVLHDNYTQARLLHITAALKFSRLIISRLLLVFHMSGSEGCAAFLKCDSGSSCTAHISILIVHYYDYHVLINRLLVCWRCAPGGLWALRLGYLCVFDVIGNTIDLTLLGLY